MFSLSFSADNVDFLVSIIHLRLISQTKITSICTSFSLFLFIIRGSSSCQQLISLPCIPYPLQLFHQGLAPLIILFPLCMFLPNGIWKKSSHIYNKLKKTHETPSTRVFLWLLPYFSCQPSWKSFLSFLPSHPHGLPISQAPIMWVSDPHLGPMVPWRGSHLLNQMGTFSCLAQLPFSIICLCVQPTPRNSLSRAPFLVQTILVFSSCFSRCFLWVSLAGSCVSTHLLNVHMTHSLVPFPLLLSRCVLKTSATFCKHWQEPRF